MTNLKQIQLYTVLKQEINKYRLHMPTANCSSFQKSYSQI